MFLDTASKNRSEIIRTILEQYLQDPEGLTAEFAKRISLALLLRQPRPKEVKDKMSMKVPDELKRDLDTLANQTGTSIESLISLMISIHMLRCQSTAPKPTP